MQQIELILKGYRMLTVEILYHLPDYPTLLQSFVRQHLVIAPRYPVLGRFLDFWNSNLEGQIHSVTVGATGPAIPSQMHNVRSVFHVH